MANDRIQSAKAILAKTEQPPKKQSATTAQYAQMMRDYDARNALRDKGSELIKLGGGTAAFRDRELDLLTPGFRADLSEFWRFGVNNVNLFLEPLKDGAARQKVLKKLLKQDSALTDALQTWAKARRASPLLWKGLEDALVGVQTELATLRPAIEDQFKSRGLGQVPVKADLVQCLDAIGREVACQAADHLRLAAIDFGGRYTGAVAAAASASTTASLNAKAREALTVTTGSRFRQKGQKGQRTFSSEVGSFLKKEFALSAEATHKSGGQEWVNPIGYIVTPWLDNIIGIGNEWAKFVYNWEAKPGDIDDLELETSILTDKLSDGYKKIEAVTPTSPAGGVRVAQRALDALALAVADRLDEIGQSDASVANKLGGAVTQLRAMTAGRLPAVTDPLSGFWQQQKSNASNGIGPMDWSKFSRNWLTGGLSDALDKWSNLLEHAPNHDPDSLYDDSWAIAETLNRYKFSVSFLKSEEARQVLLDAVEALAGEFGARLSQAQTRWGDQL